MVFDPHGDMAEAFNSIQDQRTGGGRIKEDQLISFQFYPRSTALERAKEEEEDVFSFNSIQDQRVGIGGAGGAGSNFQFYPRSTLMACVLL